MHALIFNNNIVVARDYNKKFFEAVLRLRHGFDTTLPEILGTEAHIINDEFKILQVLVFGDPQYNSKIERLVGPEYTIFEDRVEARKIVIPKSIDDIKQEFKNKIATARWEKETSGVDLGDGTIIKTDIESQAKVSGAYNFMQLKNNAQLDWKSASGWIKLNKAQIDAIATIVAEHVQACYTKEKELNDVIDSCTTHIELDALDLTFTLG